MSRPPSRTSEELSLPGSSHSSIAETPATTHVPSKPPARRASHRTATSAQGNQTETLYEKYLATSIEVKEHLKRNFDSDTEEKLLEKEKMELDMQYRRVALEVKELEREKLLAEISHAAEMRELEQEKLKLEIQQLKKNLMETGK